MLLTHLTSLSGPVSSQIVSALRPPPTKEEGPQKYKSAVEREPDASVPLFGASLMAQMVKNPFNNAEDMGSISGSGRSPGEGNGNPLQYSCLGNPLDRGTCQASPWDHKE